ncbi:MAG: CAAX protease, partial [Streptococcus vestibularis]|nr:CAAX protease [Streptococcus vestibularis]
MLLKTLGKKKAESEYKRYIARVSCSFFSLGILGLFIVCSNSLSDYALGLVVGVTI